MTPNSPARPRTAPINVAAHLPRLAAEQPDALAVAVARRGVAGEYARWSAAELERNSNRIAHALCHLGVREGVRTVVMVPPSLEFFAITFALLKIGAPMVMVDPGIGLPHLKRCLDEAEPAAFIGIPKAHVARLLFGWASRTLKTLVSVGPRVLWQGSRLDVATARFGRDTFEAIEPDPEQCAAILFTSGSTGTPKGAITPYRVFAAQVELLRTAYGITPGERDLATFPLFALFGPALGMAAVVPDMDASRPGKADPARLLAAMTEFGCTNMFGSPAVIDRLGRHCEREKLTLSSLRRAISAGAPASTESLARLQPWLPSGTEILTSYGATEALPIAMLGSRTILEETAALTATGSGVCVGYPMPGIEIAIIPIDDQPIPQWDPALALPTGEIGEIVVKGPVVTPAYHNREAATQAAKMRDEDGSLRHRMGDLGYLDGQGRLWMCGRKAHRVQTADAVLFTIPCEAVFNQHPQVRRTALVGIGASTKRPVLCVELRPGQRVDEATLFAELRALGQRHAHTRSIETFLLHPEFPVDVRHNSKIFREQLAVWAERRLPRSLTPA